MLVINIVVDLEASCGASVFLSDKENGIITHSLKVSGDNIFNMKPNHFACYHLTQVIQSSRIRGSRELPSHWE